MKLSELAHYIDPVILDRGRNYLLNGQIISLEKIGEWTFQAEVEGSEWYIVDVELDRAGEITRMECDCPYDFGPVCKHQAAVLLKLRGELSLELKKVSPHPSIPPKNLKDLLEDQSKDSLVQLLLSLAADSDVVEQRIKLHLSSADGSLALEECKKLIHTYIDTYSDDHGFVSWRNVERAVEGAELVAEKAFGSLEDADRVLAVRMYLCIMEEMLELLESADDSGGTIGGLIERSLEGIQEAVGVG
ncbi:SWIM zinc finger domain-containing protein [Ammoniphilus sp. 3BR4]|uniref:SWIM zinc finger family protein n=1 Tax=Ammoniphilus sp. 3BR4 TaxID=3158265 RepID=UPI003467BC33